MVDDRSVWTGLKRGLALRCPNCGKGWLFRGYLTVRSPCEVCGTDNTIYPSDDFPPYLTIFVAGHVVVGLFMWTDSAYALPLFLLLPFMKSATIGFCWATGLVRGGSKT
jgi:uncharacterized protein (DUF983 family)